MPYFNLTVEGTSVSWPADVVKGKLEKIGNLEGNDVERIGSDLSVYQSNIVTTKIWNFGRRFFLDYDARYNIFYLKKSEEILKQIGGQIREHPETEEIYKKAIQKFIEFTINRLFDSKLRDEINKLNFSSFGQVLDLRELLNGVRDKQQLLDIIKTIGLLPEEERNPIVLKEIIGIFNCVTEESEQIPKSIETIRSEDIVEVISKSENLIKNICDGSKIGSILHALGKISADSRTYMLEKANSQIIEQDDGYKRAFLIMLGGLILETERDRIFTNEFIEHLKSISDVNIFNAIVRTFELIPINERSFDFLQEIIEIVNVKGANYIVDVVKNIKEEDRKDVLQKAKGLVMDFKKGRCRSSVIRTVGKFELKERAKLYGKTKDFIFGFDKGMFRSAFIKAVNDFNDEEWESMRDKLKELSGYYSDYYYLTGVIKTLKSIQQSERLEILDKVVEAVRKKPYQLDLINHTLKIITRIPKDKRTEKIINDVANFFKNFSCEIRNIICEEFREIPKEDIIDLIEQSEAVVDGVSDKNIILGVLSVLKTIPKEVRAEVFDKIKDLLLEINDGLLRAYFIYLISYIPKEEIEDVIKKTRDFILGEYDIKQKKDILKVFVFVSPEKRAEVIKMFKEDNKLLSGDVLFNLFSANEDIKKSSLNYLLGLLDNIASDKIRSKNMVDAIIDCKDSLMIDEEHPLFQRAMEVYIFAGPEAAKDKKNPYVLFSSLKQNDSAESTQVSLAKKTILGQEVSWNLETIRKRKQKPYKYKDLPEGVKPEALGEMFDALKKRLESLSASKKERLSKELEAKYGFTLEKLDELKQDSIAQPFMKNLMSLRGKEDDVISNSKYYLFVIVQAILEESNELKGSELLSPQENMLLSAFYLISACDTGQRDGIARYYNGLPEKWHESGKKADRPDEQKIKSFVDNSVQAFFNETLRSDDFLKKLTGENEIEQGSHQTTYLKNRLHNNIGLNHTQEFDRFSSMIYEKLIDAETEELVISFFDEAASEKMIRLLHDNLNEALKKVGEKGNIGADALVEYLKEKGETTADVYQKYFELDEYFFPSGIKMEGVLDLLKKTGYFISS